MPKTYKERLLCGEIIPERVRQAIKEDGLYLPVPSDDPSYLNCPVCGDQAYLVCDEWSIPGKIYYFYECKSDSSCRWTSKLLTEAEYESFRPKTTVGIIHGQMKPF